MSLQYIIDGCNVINHPIFIARANKRITDQRAALLELIKSKRLTGSARNKVIVVFDGYAAAQDIHAISRQASAVEVIFSRKETADERIMKLVSDFCATKSTVVVSDDNQIRIFAKSAGAKVLGVEEFIACKDKQAGPDDEQAKTDLNYTQMQKINQELKKLWLE
jgi:predicted RNA-binding protein with PIN domain